MSRHRLTFRERDLASAIRVAKAQGVPVARYEITKDGTIVIIPGEPGTTVATTPEDDEAALIAEYQEQVRNAKI